MVTEYKSNFKTMAEKAYDIICKDIINGTLKPGQRLTRRDMAKLTGLSVIPVIEALHRLEEEGLVESEPYFGAKVIEMEEEIITDRFSLRMAIECQVIRNLTIHQDKNEIEQLRVLARQVDEMSRTGENQDEFWGNHHTFHIHMARCSRCPSFVKELKRLNLFDILRRTIISYNKVKGPAVLPGHHERLIEAIESGDRDFAENEMRNHINFSGLVTEDQF